MYALGERVLARRKNDRYWYPATIAEQGTGNYRISFDRGDVGSVTERGIVPFAMKAGDRVLCRWKRGNVYYTGIVTKLEEGRCYIKYDDGDEEWSSTEFIKIHPFSVISGSGTWWRRLVSPEFFLTQLELISYLGLFLLILFALSASVKSSVERLPGDLFSFQVIVKLAGYYWSGLIPIAVVFALLLGLSFRNSLKKHRFHICKAFIINLSLSFIVTNYVVLTGLIEPARLNGLMFFSIFASLLPPIAIAVYYDAKRGKGFVREFLVFAAMLLLATLPQLLRMSFSMNSIVYYFMDLAVVYFAAFFVFIPFEWSKGSKTFFEKLIKIVLLYSGIVLIPITYIMVYACIGAIGEKIFGPGPVPNTLFSGGSGGIFGPLEVAPASMMYLFIMEYLRALSFPDLIEGMLLFWGLSATTMNLSEKANLFYDQGYDFNLKKIEVLIGGVLLAAFLSQPLWR